MKKVISSNPETLWEVFLESLNEFSDDFMEDGRLPDFPSEREEL